MVVYPAQLTSEEKALRKRYAKLQEKLKELKQSNNAKRPSSSQPSGIGPSKKTPTKVGGPTEKKDTSSPKDALAAAKRLVEMGKVNIKKQTAKTTGFKRVGEGANRGNPAPPAKRSSSFPPSYTPSSSNLPLIKPKLVPKREESRQLYSRFIRASEDITHHKIPRRPEESQSEDVPPPPTEKDRHSVEVSHAKKECTVHVSWGKDTQLLEDALRIAFTRFGSIVDLKHQNLMEAHISFETPSIAKTVLREMNKGMIHGTEIRVEFASEENGYIELPPEAASQPWARIAAGMDVSQDVSVRKRPVISYGSEEF